MTDIANLYIQYPEIYDSFSNDRDFLTQSNTLLKISNHEGNATSVMELFAGPARHSFAFRNLGCRVYSLDSSEGMKKFAIEKGFQERKNYIVERLPTVIKLSEKISIFTLLRFSVGYLNKNEIREVIKWCKGNSTSNAKLFIEIHKPSVMSSSMDKLEISQREFNTDIGHVKCKWPSNPPIWNTLSWEVTMPIDIEVEGVKYEFSSREMLHSFEDIKDIAISCGCHIDLITPDKLLGFNSDSLVVTVNL